MWDGFKDQGDYIETIRLLEPDMAWEMRWHFRPDMNADGVVTISDAWIWLKWVFMAPGDFALLAAMKWVKPLAHFLEITPASLFGWWSALLSWFLWFACYEIMKAEVKP